MKVVYGDKVVKHRKFIILLTSLFLLAGGYMLTRIYMDNRIESFLPKKDPIAGLFIHVSKEFGTSKMDMIVVESLKGDVFQKDVLECVREISSSLKKIQGVRNVISIINMTDIKKIEGGVEVAELIKDIPDEEGLRKLREYVLSKEMFRKSIVSEDGKFTAISVFLSGQHDEIAVSERVIKESQRVAEKWKDSVKLYFGGMPVSALYGNMFAVKDLQTLLPVVIIFILIVLFVTFRSVKVVLFILGSMFVGSVLMFALLPVFNVPMTMISPIMPVVIIAMGSAYGIHVFNRISLYARERDFQQACSEGLDSILPPVAMAAFTTLAGFASFVVARLTIIKHFGIFTAGGIFWCFILSVTFFPALLSTFPLSRKSLVTVGERREFRLLLKAGEFILQKPLFFIFFWLFLAVGSLFLLPRISREVNFTTFFPENSAPRIASRIMEEHFDGAMPVLIYYSSDDGGTIKNSALLKKLFDVEIFLDEIEDVSSFQSVADLLAEMNYQLYGRFKVPDTDEGVANLWLMLEGQDIMEQLVSGDEKKLLAMGRVREIDTALMKKIDVRIEKILRNINGTYTIIDTENMTDEEKITLMKKHVFPEKAELLSTLILKYTNRKISEEKIVSSLNSLFSPPDDSFLKAKLTSQIEKYLRSDESVVLIDESKVSEFAKKALATLKDRKTFAEAVKEYVPPKDFDLIEDLFVELRDIERFLLQEMTVKKITELLRSSVPEIDKIPELKKKVTGILYGLTDRFQIVKGNYSGEKITVNFIQTGMPPLVNQLDKFMVRSFWTSMALSFFVVFFLISAEFRSPVLGVIGILPILLTIAISYALLPITSSPLDYMTMLMGSIAIGAGIDYSIHLLHRLREAFRETGDIRKSILDVFRTAGRAILANAISVGGGFLVLLLSSLKPLKVFGMLTSAMLLLSAAVVLGFIGPLLMIVGASPFIQKSLRKGGAR